LIYFYKEVAPMALPFEKCRSWRAGKSFLFLILSIFQRAHMPPVHQIEATPNFPATIQQLTEFSKLDSTS